MMKCLITGLLMWTALFVSGQGLAWEYTKGKADEMGRPGIDIASLRSSNKITLSSPFDDPQYGYLYLSRPDAKGTAAVLLSMLEGIFVCQGICEVNIRFDDQPMTTVPAMQTANSKSSNLSILPNKDFMAKLSSATTLLIEPEIYENGREIFRFNVKGLKWE